VSEEVGGSGIEARLARLEGAVDGLKLAMEGLRQSTSITLAAVAAIGAILIGLDAYMLQHIDAIPSALQQTVSTLSAAITAARQQPAFVVTVPLPQAPPATK
jgi:hypothetical protein